MPVLGLYPLGTKALGGSQSWGATSVAIVTPATVVTTVPLTVTWLYANSASSPQAQYRITLRTQSGALLHDSGLLPGASSSYDLPYSLADLSAYMVRVTVFSAQGQDGFDDATFLVQTGSSVTAPVNTDVGKIYEVAINGVGYMLRDDGDEQQFQWGRQVVSLDAQRLVQGETAFNDAVERYSFFKWNDWSGGAGQRIGSREGSSNIRYFDSEGVDPFTVPGQLSLTYATTKTITAAYSGVKAVAVGDALYSVKATDTLRYQNTIGGSEQDVVLSTMTGILDITSDGSNWYVCNGSAVQRGTTADPAADWSTLDAGVIDWAGARLCAATKAGGTGTYRVFETIADAGTSEAVRLTLPAGWNITNFSGGTGFVYFGAYNGNTGLVYAWQTGSSDAPSVAWELPLGERPVHVYFYQGQVMVRADRAGVPVIYRCPATEGGQITPFLIAELDGSSTGQFAGVGRFVYFSWASMVDAGNSGVGVIDLSTGGYAKSFSADVPGDVTSLTIWQGRVVFTIASVGAYMRTLEYVTSGWLKTSVLDGASAMEKVYDEISVQALPLLADQSISLELSLDRGDSYVIVEDGVLEGAGLNRLTLPLDHTGTSASLRLTLEGPGTSTPSAILGQVKVHPLGMADVILQLPIACFDNLNGLGGSQIPAKPGDGARRARALEALAQTQVDVQDIDWPLTGLVETYEVVGVRLFKRSTRDPRIPNKLSLGMVAVLTLRRPAT